MWVRGEEERKTQESPCPFGSAPKPGDKTQPAPVCEVGSKAELCITVWVMGEENQPVI